MTYTMSTVPFSERFSTSQGWAQKRAELSATPDRFMVSFHNAMAVCRREGEAVVLERIPHWEDPTRLAAEIEALAARRAMAHWGTTWGICQKGRNRKADLAA
jgi:hypothetical protein